GNFRGLEDFSLEAPKTKRMADMTRALNIAGQKALLLTDTTLPNIVKSCRNLPKFSVLPVGQVSTYDVVKVDVVIFTRAALEQLRTLWGNA
ncbi:MAG: 50S ribosomal protein L4, partial [bacterium]|nr:50S ribosomal protein L4 [bacterium]